MERKVAWARIANLPQCLSLFYIGIYSQFYFPFKLDSERSSFFSESYARRVKKLVNWRRDWFACASAVVPCRFAALPSRLLSTDLKQLKVTNKNKKLLAVHIQTPSIIYHRFRPPLVKPRSTHWLLWW